MRFITDATSTQTKRNAGIGNYVSALIKQFEGNETFNHEYLLYEGFDVPKVFTSKNHTKWMLNGLGAKTPMIAQFLINRVLKNRSEFVYFCPYFLNSFPTDGTPLVLTMHDLALLHFDYYSDRGGFFDLIRKYEYMHWLYRTPVADKLIVHAQFTKDEYLAIFPEYPAEDIIVVPLAVELEETETDTFIKYLPGDWGKKQYFIYMGGGIQANKNSIGVVEAYKYFVEQIKSEGTRLEDVPYLVIAGKIFTNTKSKQARKLHDLIEASGLKDKVVFTGFYDDREKYSLLKNSLGFIHLSTYEGWGIAVAEAMRAGVSVIADNNSTYPEVVGETGILVDGNDPVESGIALLKLYSNRDFAAKLGQDARKYSMQYSWESTASKTSDVLQEVYEKYFSLSNKN